MGTLSKLYNALFKNLRQNNNDPLTGESLKQVLVSAMYAEQQSAYLNSYETGLNPAAADTILQNYWGIYSSAEASETLNYLLEKGHRFYFDSIYEALTIHKETYTDFLTSSFPDKEEMEKVIHLFRGLRGNINHLISDEIITRLEDLKVYNVYGWDYGRLSFMSRLCRERNLIPLHVMKEYLHESLNRVKGHFSDWESFSKSYVIGRAMWGGAYNAGMAAIGKELLTRKKSPWVQMPL